MHYAKVNLKFNPVSEDATRIGVKVMWSCMLLPFGH